MRPRYFQHEYNRTIVSLSPGQAKKARARGETWPGQVWVRKTWCLPGQCPHCVGGVRTRDLEAGLETTYDAGEEHEKGLRSPRES